MKWYFQCLIAVAFTGLVLVLFIYLPSPKYLDPGPGYEIEPPGFVSPRDPPKIINTCTGTIGDREIMIVVERLDDETIITGWIGDDEIDLRIERRLE